MSREHTKGKAEETDQAKDNNGGVFLKELLLNSEEGEDGGSTLGKLKSGSSQEVMEGGKVGFYPLPFMPMVNVVLRF